MKTILSRLLQSSFILLCLCSNFSLAQETAHPALLFIWNDILHAQSLTTGELIPSRRFSAETLATVPNTGLNVYRFEQSPLNQALADGYGFHQGLWSSDRSRFVFLAIAPNSPDYRLIQIENGQQEILFSGQVGLERGYLVPLGWKISGELVLLERHALHNLSELRLWQFSSNTGTLSLETVASIPDLKGNSVTLDNGLVFIGFDTVGLLGYLLNMNDAQTTPFLTSFALQEAPSVFETYPIAVMGQSDMHDFEAWFTLQTDETLLASSYPANEPFLYWILPDYARSITCYPDSEWVALNFAVECAGLATPREYQGHEGTDIGGKPAGLALNTPVYAAARGVVIRRNTICPSGDVSCGDAYGNYLLLEHSLVRGNNIETWFTGYAHLNTVLVEPKTYISELGLPIALSGDTGLGGAHLHFEVRSPQAPSPLNWIDPWDNRSGNSLWIGGNERPIAALTAFPPPTLLLCQTAAGNNIRTGPDTTYEVISQTTSTSTYEVFQIQTITFGQVTGDWYHIRWAESEQSGWIWSDLMNDCSPVSTATMP